VWQADDRVHKNGTIIVKRILRNYFADYQNVIAKTCPCTYVYGYNDTCPQYFNAELIRKLFPFITNVDSFINTHAGSMAITSTAVEKGLWEIRSVGSGAILDYGYEPVRKLYDPNSERVLHAFPDSFFKPKHITINGKDTIKDYSDNFYWSPSNEENLNLDFFQDTLKHYGRKRLGRKDENPAFCFLIEEKVTLKNNQIEKRELLSISFGTDLEDGSRPVFITRVKAKELIPAFLEIDKRRKSKAYDFLRRYTYNPTNLFNPNTEFLGQYPPEFSYEPLNFWRSYSHPAAFSEYAEIDGKPFGSRKEMLEWLNQPENPFRLQKPNIKGKKGHFLVRFRVLDLINDYPDLKTDAERNYIFQGYYGKNKNYADYKDYYEKNAGFITQYQKSIREGILSGKYKMFSPDTLVNELTSQELIRTINKITDSKVNSLREALYHPKFTSYLDVIAVMTIDGKQARVDTTFDTFVIQSIKGSMAEFPIYAVKSIPIHVGNGLLEKGLNPLLVFNFGSNKGLQTYIQSIRMVKSLRLQPALPVIWNKKENKNESEVQ